MAKEISLSLIIPCFNEEKRIHNKFDAAYNFLVKKINNIEIILVNDGSTDKTEKILNEIAKRYKKVKVITYSQNRGKGYAVKKAVMQSRGEIIGFTDADFAISLDELPKILDLISQNQTDIIIGNRKEKAAKLNNRPDFLRRFFSFTHSKVNNYFLNLGPITDTLCGFKFFKRKVALDLFSDLTIYRWFFDLDILIKARQKKYRISQIAVSWAEIRGGSVKIINAIKTSTTEHLIIYFKFFNSRIFSAVLLGLILLILLPFLINPQSLTRRNGDYSDLVWPDYFFIKQSITQYHQIPLWNPTVFSGIPEIANPQSPLIYPPNILALILPIDLAIVLLIGLHVFISGIYLFKLGRDLLKWSTYSTVILTMGIVFSPFYWSKFSVGHLSMGFAMYLIGPILFYGFSLIQKKRLRNLLFLSLFLSLQYLNYPTIWYYTCFFGLVTSLLFYRDFKNIIYLFLSTIISLVFILPIFLLQLQAGLLITRSGLNITDLSIPLWSIKRFLVSVLIPSNLTGDLETEVWLYPTISLVVLGFIGFLKSTFKYKYIICLILLPIIFITLGSRTPVFGLLAKYLPGFSYLRVSTRDWFVLVVTQAILAGWVISSFKPKYQPIILLVTIFDLLIFSTLRLWFVPNIMTYQNPNKFANFLTHDPSFRYYCTSRCLSARETVPLYIDTADGYHLIILKNYHASISKAGGFPPPKYTGNIPSTDDYGAQPIASDLGKFSVRWIISPYLLSNSGLRLQSSEPGYYFYENSLALNRVRFSKSQNTAIIQSNTPNYLKIKTQNQFTDTLILADSYYSGWTSRIDGQPTLIAKYYGWARAITVPTGNHIVEFEFKPFNQLF